MRVCRMENSRTSTHGVQYYNNVDAPRMTRRPAGPSAPANQNRAIMMFALVSATTVLKNLSPEMLLSSRPKPSAKDLLFVRSAVIFLKVANSFLTGSECYITGVYLNLQV